MSGWAHAIDQGSASARGRAWLAETSSGVDDGRVSLIFLDAEDTVLGSEEPACEALTPLTWELREAAAPIPVGTREIKVRVAIDRVSGSTANVAVDDVTLEIDPGEVRYLAVAAHQISGQVGRGFRGLKEVEVV